MKLIIGMVVITLAATLVGCEMGREFHLKNGTYLKQVENSDGRYEYQHCFEKKCSRISKEDAYQLIKENADK